MPRCAIVLFGPAVAQDRLRRFDDGHIVLTLNTGWAGGTRHLVFKPLELLESLPRTFRDRRSTWCFTAACAQLASTRGRLWRAPCGCAAGRERCARGGRQADDGAGRSSPGWADLMRRALDIDGCLPAAVHACGCRRRFCRGHDVPKLK